MRKLLRSAVCLLLPAAACAVVLLPAPTPAHAYPKPSVYPVSWELKFEHGKPKRIVVQPPGTNTPLAFYYMTYTVTNNTSQDQQFLPSFEMVSKEGTVVRSDKGIPVGVFEAIRRAEGKKTLEPMEKITGRLLQGEDQARDGVAIWPEPADPRMGTFSIFVTGLSGEAVLLQDGKETTIADWTKVTDEDRKKFTILRKTFEVDYQIPGDEIRPGNDAVNQVNEEWVMR